MTPLTSQPSKLVKSPASFNAAFGASLGIPACVIAGYPQFGETTTSIVCAGAAVGAGADYS